MRSLIAFAGLCLLLVLTGCQFGPDFPVTALAFDERLLGTWTIAIQDEAGVRNENDAPIVRVERRAVDVSKGRTNPMGFGLTAPTDEVTTTSAYSIVFENIKFDQATKLGGPDRLRLEGYLVKVGEQRLLAAHVSYEQLAMSTPFPLAIPVLWFVRLDIADDEIVVRQAPERFGLGLVWLPGVQVATAELPIVPTPVEERLPDSPRPRGFFATTSIDRALEYYELATNRSDFWVTDPWRFRRTAASKVDGPAPTPGK